MTRFDQWNWLIERNPTPNFHAEAVLGQYGSLHGEAWSPQTLVDIERDLACVRMGEMPSRNQDPSWSFVAYRTAFIELCAHNISVEIKRLGC